jgi:hypothetical protein
MRRANPIGKIKVAWFLHANSRNKSRPAFGSAGDHPTTDIASGGTLQIALRWTMSLLPLANSVPLTIGFPKSNPRHCLRKIIFEKLVDNSGEFQASSGKLPGRIFG